MRYPQPHKAPADQPQAYQDTPGLAELHARCDAQATEIARKPAALDFDFTDHGSIGILTPLSESAFEWVDEHLPGDHQTWGANGIVVERRYTYAIVDGIRAAGLTIG